MYSPKIEKINTVESIIDTDANNIVPFHASFFELINLGFADDILKHNYQSQLTESQKELNFKYGRVVGLMHQSIIDKIPESNTYNFTHANRIIDYLYSIKLIPFLEIGKKTP